MVGQYNSYSEYFFGVNSRVREAFDAMARILCLVSKTPTSKQECKNTRSRLRIERFVHFTHGRMHNLLTNGYEIPVNAGNWSLQDT